MGQLLCLLMKALGRTRLRRGAEWLCRGRGIQMMMFPSLFPPSQAAFGLSAGRCLSSPSRGSVEKEAWQRRVKISGFLPFAVT